MNKTMTISTIIVIILIILISRFYPSYVTNNIDNLSHVVAIGVDKSEFDNHLKVSFEFNDVSAFGKDSSSESSSPIINTVVAPTINSCINLMNSYLGKKIELSHCKAIIFSTDLAKEGIFDELSELVNNTPVRPTTNFIVSSVPAKDYLENSSSKLEKVLTKYYDIFPNSSKYTGYTANVTIGRFYDEFRNTSIGCDAILGGVNSASVQNKASNSQSKESGQSSQSSSGSEQSGESGGAEQQSSEASGSEQSGESSSQEQSNQSGGSSEESNNSDSNKNENSENTEFLTNKILSGNSSIIGERGTENIGLGVFTDYKYVGALSALETLCHSIIDCDVETFLYSIDDTQDSGTILDFSLVKSSPPKIKVDIIDDIPHVSLDVKFTGKILNFAPNLDYSTPGTLDYLSNKVNKALEADFNNYFDKVAREYHADIDDIYKIARKKFKTNSEWENFDWKSKYSNAIFHINVYTNITSSLLGSNS